MRLSAVLLGILAIAGGFLTPTPARAQTNRPKVAVIVGPVGSLTPTYLRLARRVVRAADNAGARVATAFSPHATPRRVRRAVRNANVVVYFGHGNGYPNPYTSILDRGKVNGWGLQGPNRRGTHADSWSNGTMKYYGERWIRNRTHPARGWVMVYGQTCYAAGSNEPWMRHASRSVARRHVAYYSRTPLRMGASAYFATNYGDQRVIVRKLLTHRRMSYRHIFRTAEGFHGTTINVAHPFARGRVELSKGHNWYLAFAGRPHATPRRTWAIVGG
jgi:hypothetical protein